ncbi:MAG: glycogen synthase GlgA [Sulfuriferula sp.]|nr:glycogen synthase GlgA [Sulfuriferula sp.]
MVTATRVLFAASEAYPLIKTGGLGDIAYSLPHALHQAGADVRLILPAYRAVLMQAQSMRILGWLDVRGAKRVHSVRVLEISHAQFAFPIYLVDIAALFDRPGNPYTQADGQDWGDNAERFTVFARAVADIAGDVLGTGWRADVVHANDWQTGLVPAFLRESVPHIKSVFTIHNMAYGGHFSLHEFNRLALPRHWWTTEGVEFYGGFSMLKAGIVYADEVTTVSPTYAGEICTAEFGYGMQGVLLAARHKLHGILNGIDEAVWNPASDVHLPAHYSANRRQPGKALNKQALLQHFNLPAHDAAMQVPLVGMVSRLVEQKGVDLILAALPHWLLHTPLNFVFVGTGDAWFEAQLREFAVNYPQRIAVFIGYDEALAHLVEAGADMFMMPSRFEPCGLNQMYSLRYGTPPIVYRTGGLADTVVDATPAHVMQGLANGFVFDELTTAALVATVDRALIAYTQPRIWQALVRTGMRQSFGWLHSAQAYLALYKGTDR